MDKRLNEPELAGLVEAIGDRLDDLLDEAPAPEDPAELERLAVIATAAVRHRDLPDEVRQAWADALESRGDRDAATLLAAGAALVPVIADPAGEALAHLRGAGVEPRVPEGFGALRAGDARHGVLGDGSDLYMVHLQRPAEERAQVASLIVERDPEPAGTLARGMISGPLDPPAAMSLFEQRDLPEAPALEPVAVADVERVLRDAAARMTELDIPASGELALSLPLLSQAVCGDVSALAGIPTAPPGWELHVEPEDEEGFEKVQDGLLAEFAAWVERTGAGEALRRSGDLLAAAILHWKWGYADGYLGHWTIEDVEEFFLDYAPRKLPSDDDIVEDAPDCAAGLMRFLDEVDLLTGDPVEELVACCESVRAEFTGAARDPARWGPAKAMVAQMQADGVDPTDKEALQAWMDDFNSRSREERDRVIGPALDRQVAAALTGDPEAPTPWEIGGALAPGDRGNAMQLALGWFPAGEYEIARERWDDLRELWTGIPHDEYCRRIEATLRGWAARGTRPRLVPIQIADYVAWCEDRGEDPVEARAGYAAHMSQQGMAWPPGRNEPCWCGSERKYKKCCGAVTGSVLHPLDAPL